MSQKVEIEMNEEENPLEQFYSDEESSGNKSDTEEDVPIIIKKISKSMNKL